MFEANQLQSPEQIRFTIFHFLFELLQYLISVKWVILPL